MKITIRNEYRAEPVEPDYDRKATHRVTLSNADIENILDCMRIAEMQDPGNVDQKLFDRLLRSLG